MRSSQLLCAGLLLAGLASPAAAEDLVICVDTVAEFESAMATAQTANPLVSRVLIRLEQGTYNLSSAAFMRTTAQASSLPIREPLVIAGGYTANCAGRVLDPDNTVLLNTGSRRFDLDVARDFFMSGVTFQNFANRIAIGNFNLDDTQQDVEVSQVRFTGGSGGITLSAEAGDGLSRLTLKNTLVFNRSGDGQCAIRLNGDAGPDTSVRLIAANNTIAGNGTAGDGVCFGNVELPEFYNNIFYLNPGEDLIGTGSNGLVTARNNLFQSVAGVAYAVNSNNSSANPLFSNVLAGDLSLGAGSPAINAGFASVPFGVGTVDATGNTRVVGSVVDRGALESANAGTATLVVTSTGNSGAGTLRDAITQANATPGSNTIVFNITTPAGCPKVINLSTALPDITESVIIDGTTQPGYEPNTVDIGYDGTQCVLLRGGSTLFGLEVPGGAPAATRLQVDGLAFGGFAYGIFLAGGSAHRITGSHFGVPLAGSNTMGGGIYVAGPDDVTIGGAGSGERNVFGNITGGGGIFTAAGVLVSAASERTEVVNNIFGNQPNGVLEAPLDYGIFSDGSDGVFFGNLVNNATEWGVRLGESATGNSLGQTRMGLPALCIGPCAVGQANTRGILIEGALNTLYNTELAGDTSTLGMLRVTGNDNSLSGNLVYGAGINRVPVDIGDLGFDPIDIDNVSPPAGNRGLNWPEIVSAQRTANGNTQVVVRLQTGNGAYSIRLYTSARSVNTGGIPRCEARQFVGSTGVTNITSATPGTNGTADFIISLPPGDFAFPLVTAQAVKQARVGTEVRSTDTSEIGNCVELPLFGNGFEAVD